MLRNEIRSIGRDQFGEDFEDSVTEVLIFPQGKLELIRILTLQSE